MGENDRPDDLRPFQLKLFYFLQLYFPYVRAAAALSLLYPSVTQMTNLPKLGASRRLPQMPAWYTVTIGCKVFSQAVSKKSAASSLL